MKLENISKEYYSENNGTVKALNEISLEFISQKFYAIMGESGSGKTTLINILGLMDSATVGKYYLNDLDVSNISPDKRAKIRNENIGFVFQNFYLNSRLTALENVLLPTLINNKDKEETKNRALSLFEKFGLKDRINHYPKELSGGECQRVGIIRALINNPSIILADEPTGNLDHKNEVEVFKYLKQISQEGKCVIVVSHNPSIKKYADKVIYLEKGAIIYEN